jgi:hypothetical protein
MLIPTNLLQIEQLVKNLVVGGEDLSDYFDNIDQLIHAICMECLVPTSEIPVDSDGYVTSIHLRFVAQYYGIFIIMSGYSGVGGYPKDVYDQELAKYWKLYETWASKITREIILGGTGDDPLPNKSAYVRNVGLFF